MLFLLRRAARMAASLTRFARSAPEKPGVRRASASRSTVLSSGLPLMWTSRISRAALDVRAVEDDLAVEAARAQERRVEDVGPVGGGDDDHVGVRVEAVHLDQDLVQGLLALVVRAAEAGAALAADRVDLVDEDDARRVALRLLEQVADAGGADADEHLDELGAGDARRTARPPRRRRRARGASCRCRAGRRAARRAGCARRAQLNFSGYLRNSTTSVSSCFASSTPATSSKVTTVLLPRNMRARLLPKLIAWLLVPWAWRIMKKMKPPMRSTGRRAVIRRVRIPPAALGSRSS